MIERIGILRRKEGLGSEAFRRYWRETHGPLAAKIPGLRRYEQSHVADAGPRQTSRAHGSDVIDGFSQLWFDDAASMQQAMAAEASATAGADHAEFIGHFQLALVEPHIVVPAPTDRPVFKRMAMLRRRSDISAKTFRDEWLGLHATLVSRIPHVSGYTQNLVVGRNVHQGTEAAYEALPIDGIAELWYDDLASMRAAFAAPETKTLMCHTEEFVAEVTAFLVDSHRFV